MYGSIARRAQRLISFHDVFWQAIQYMSNLQAMVRVFWCVVYVGRIISECWTSRSTKLDETSASAR